MCPPGFVCDKLNTVQPSRECPQGFYCPNDYLPSSTVIDPILTNIISISTCKLGTFCPGGTINAISEVSNSTMPFLCTLGFFCNLASINTFGVGPCPAGHYCPSMFHHGIVCPPRHYCMARGNIIPLICTKGK